MSPVSLKAQMASSHNGKRRGHCRRLLERSEVSTGRKKGGVRHGGEVR